MSIKLQWKAGLGAVTYEIWRNTANTTASGGVGINLTAGGSGYTSAPAVSITGGGGSGATADAIISGGAVTSVTITNGGTGYTSPPTIAFTGGGGTGAAATAVVGSGSVSSVTMTNAGDNGYTGAPAVSFSGGGGSAAAGTAVLAASGGVRAQSMAFPSTSGYGYTSTPTVGFSGGAGSGAAGTAVMGSNGQVRVIAVTAPGSGYSSAPTVGFTGGGGSGAAGTANLSGNTVVSVTMTSVGSGYTSQPAVGFSGGGGSGAAATAYLDSSMVVSVNMTNLGTGYTSAATIGFTGGSPVVAATPPVTFVYKGVASVTITNAGTGYSSEPTVTFAAGFGGNNAAGTAVLGGAITSATMDTGGSGYTSAPTVGFSGGGGTGAAGTAVIATSSVASVNVTAIGTGYVTPPTIGFSGGGGSGAAATATVGTAAIIESAATGNTYVDTTAAEGTTYYYWVKAVNADGTSGFSASSGAIVAGKTLAPPGAVLATLFTVSDTVVTWATVAGATSYKVYRNTVENFATSSEIGSTTGLTYTDTPPLHDTLYVYWVTALDGSGHVSNPSFAAGGFSAPAVPAVPGSVDASDNQEGQVEVSWAAATRAERYEVWRSETNDSATATQLGYTLTLSFIDTTVGAPTTYYYWVKSVNYTGTSAFSASASGAALVFGIPDLGPPFNLFATNDLVDVIEVSWTVVAGVDDWLLHKDGVLLATLPAATLTYDDTAFVADVEYLYEMKASNAVGTSAFSSGWYGKATGAALDAPTNCVASDTIVGEIRITADTVATATGYSVWRNTVLTLGTATNISGVVSSLGAYYADTAVTPDTNYYYWVRAHRGSLAGPFSNSETGWSPAAPWEILVIQSGNYDETYTLAAGTLGVTFNASSIADRLQVYNNGSLIWDTGCATGISNFSGGISAGSVRFVVAADCAGSIPSSSAWTMNAHL